MEAGVAQRMAVAPERMQIPLGKMVFAKGPG
jgi:hypothetical protein